MHWISASPPGDGAAWTERPPVVPGYRLDEVLGRGAGGPVWRAWPKHPAGSGDGARPRDRALRRDEVPDRFAAGGMVGFRAPTGDAPSAVAVKIVPNGPAAARELAVLRAVHHPFVVPLLDSVVLADGTLALVLMLVEGGSLRSLVAARGSLTAGEVVTVLSPLARALGDLHSRGVQHGDVAPGNVLLERSGRPLLSDLGTVRITGASRDEVFGTAGYVDPVVLTGGTASPASDVYGLGAVGWFALVGEPPPAAPLRPRLAELVPEAPAALVEAVEAAVDPDPARRPEPLDLARSVHAACRPAPLWRWRAGPDDGGLTRRLRPARAAPEELDGLEPADGCADRAVDESDGSTPTGEAGARHRAERGLLRRLTPRRGWQTRGLSVGVRRPSGRGISPWGHGPRLVGVGAVVGGVRAVVCLVVAGALVAGLWFAAGPVLTWAGIGVDRGATGGSGGGPAPGVDVGARGVSTPGPSVAPAPSGSGPARSSGSQGAAETTPSPAASPTPSPTASPRGPGVPATGGARDGPYGDLSAAGTARAVVRELSVRRAAWLRSARMGAAPSATAPGSAAAAADAAAQRTLRAAGLSYRHLTLSVREVSVLQAGPGKAVVRATTDVSGYEVVDAAGRVRYRVRPRRGTPAVLHLVLTAGGWRVRAVMAP